MRNWGLFIFLVLFGCQMNAQDLTFRQSRGFGYANQKNVLVVPFEDRMFLSDINREVASRTGMDLDEIKESFRQGLIQTIVEMGMDHHNFIDPYELPEDDQYRVMGQVYRNLSYDYEEVVPLEEVKDKNLLDKILEVEEEEQQGRGTYMENGEIKSWYDDKERFMNARLNDEGELSELLETEDLDYLLVITELDIQVMRDVNRDVGQEWPRRVKVHFSLIDKSGKVSFGSAAYDYYEAQEKDIYTIIRKSFDYPSAQIIAKINELEAELIENPEEKEKETETTSPSKKEKLKDKLNLKRFVQDDEDDDF